MYHTIVTLKKGAGRDLSLMPAIPPPAHLQIYPQRCRAGNPPRRISACSLQCRDLKGGGMWVYDNEIDSVAGSFENGDVVEVRDLYIPVSDKKNLCGYSK